MSTCHAVLELSALAQDTCGQLMFMDLDIN